MLSYIFSLMLLGNVTTIDDVEILSDDEIDALEYDIYNYEYRLRLAYQKLVLELEILENGDLGTVDNPYGPDDRYVMQMIHQPEVGYDVYSLIEIVIFDIYTDDDALEIIDVEVEDENFEWMLFDVDVRVLHSSDKNLAYFITEEDFCIENVQETDTSEIQFDDKMQHVDIYERARHRGLIAKQVPKDESFNLIYQYANSDEAIVIHIDDVAEYQPLERED